MIASPGPFCLSPLPESSATVLRLLAAHLPNWPEVALVAARDPALCLLLLSTSPLQEGELEDGLNCMLGRRLEVLGADLLRAWLLGIGAHEPVMSSGNALVVAECALHLALETHYPRPDEAYLGGLWYSLFEAPPVAPDDAQPPTSLLQLDNHRQYLARLVRQCALPGTLADALELGELLDEQVSSAHPLVALLLAARKLAADGWEQRVEHLATLTSLSTTSLISLRTDVGYIVAGHAAYPAPAAAGATALTTTRSARQLPALLDDESLRAAALHGLIVAAFADLDAESASKRLAIACPLLAQCALPLVLVPDEDGALHPLLKFEAESPAAWTGELGLREDDETSCIALALRTGKPTVCFPAGSKPGRSMRDWHLVRWLGQRGFCCLPLHIPPHGGVAILGLDHEQAIGPTERWLISELLGAAGRTLFAAKRLRASVAVREAEMHARFRDHVRRIAHEASNPLTVIKSRLSLLGQSHPEDTTLQEDMSLLNAELDRIGNLLRQAGKLPTEETESSNCNVVDLLHEMRAMYGDTLFTRRGIQLELRAASGVPRVAMPSSALKQVLLNLLRNASEALQPGGRLSVSLAGQLIADGHPCAEIRLIDNGPGLPPERTANLFSVHASQKGGQHQGIGLSVVRDILAQWKASILCRSQPGSGTSFQIFIPLEHSA